MLKHQTSDENTNNLNGQKDFVPRKYRDFINLINADSSISTLRQFIQDQKLACYGQESFKQQYPLNFNPHLLLPAVIQYRHSNFSLNSLNVTLACLEVTMNACFDEIYGLQNLNNAIKTRNPIKKTFDKKTRINRWKKLLELIELLDEYHFNVVDFGREFDFLDLLINHASPIDLNNNYFLTLIDFCLNKGVEFKGHRVMRLADKIHAYTQSTPPKTPSEEKINALFFEICSRIFEVDEESFTKLSTFSDKIANNLLSKLIDASNDEQELSLGF